MIFKNGAKITIVDAAVCKHPDEAVSQIQKMQFWIAEPFTDSPSLTRHGLYSGSVEGIG